MPPAKPPMLRARQRSRHLTRAGRATATGSHGAAAGCATSPATWIRFSTSLPPGCTSARLRVRKSERSLSGRTGITSVVSSDSLSVASGSCSPGTMPTGSLPSPSGSVVASRSVGSNFVLRKFSLGYTKVSRELLHKVRARFRPSPFLCRASASLGSGDH
jgi:hypothetical protein